jgi:hypothetical protein
VLKYVIIPILICVLLVSSINVTYAAYENQYVFSSSLKPGMWAYYKVYFHPFIEYLNITIINFITPSVALIQIQIITMYHVSITQYQLITVKGMDDDNITLQIGNQNLIASPTIYLPQYQIEIDQPFVSPYLNKGDYINLDQRQETAYNLAGVTIINYASTFLAYSYRPELTANIQMNGFILESWIWDRQTGVLMSYTSMLAIPHTIILVATNMWIPAFLNVTRATSLMALANDWTNLFIGVVGLFFELWEPWVIILVIGLLWYSKNWLQNYIHTQKALQAYEPLDKLLKEVNKQGERIKYVVTK